MAKVATEPKRPRGRPPKELSELYVAIHVRVHPDHAARMRRLAGVLDLPLSQVFARAMDSLERELVGQAKATMAKR